MPDSNDHERGLLNVNDACKFLGVGRDTIYRLANRGEIEMIKVGDRATRITQSSLDRFIKNAKRYKTTDR